MSNQTKPAGPKHEFYRNKVGGGIYPAMTSPAGYEDKNPDEWEPASDEEVAHEKAKTAKVIAARTKARRAEAKGEAVSEAPQAAPDVVDGPVFPPLADASGNDLPFVAA